MNEIHRLLKMILVRLDKIENELSKPKVSNINKPNPEFKLIKTDD